MNKNFSIYFILEKCKNKNSKEEKILFNFIIFFQVYNCIYILRWKKEWNARLGEIRWWLRLAGLFWDKEEVTVQMFGLINSVVVIFNKNYYDGDFFINSGKNFRDSSCLDTFKIDSKATQRCQMIVFSTFPIFSVHKKIILQNHLFLNFGCWYVIF